MTGPSASGSENGTPTSSTSAPAQSSALRISPERGRSGSPAVVYVMRPVRPAARNRANVSSRRLTTPDSRKTVFHEDAKGTKGTKDGFVQNHFVIFVSLRVFVRDRDYASAFSSVFTSLSPRPDRLTSRIAFGPSVLAMRRA